MAGLGIVACAAGDVSCANPIPGSSGATNDSGDVNVSVHSGFKGYFQLSPAPNDPDLMPTLLWAFPVPDKAVAPSTRNWSLFHKASFDAIVNLGGGKPTSTAEGHVLFIAQDCSGADAEGIEASTPSESADSYVYYADENYTPSTTQQATGHRGVGGFINLPPGPTVIQLRRQSDGMRIGSYNLVVRAGTLTSLILAPN